MNTIEICLVGTAGVGLALFVRGCFKASVSACFLGLLLGMVACAGYFFAFSETHVAYMGAMLFAPFLVVLLTFGRVMKRPMGKALAGTIIVLIAAAVMGEYKLLSMGNALLVIEPYRSGKIWRFDEPRLHLKGEPFVQGIPEMIDKMVEKIPGSESSVRLIFSQRPFPGGDYRVDWRRAQDGGNWYFSEQYQMEGWLCPALFKFFPRAPQHIYIRAEAK